MSAPPRVRIHYRRPPDRVEVHEQYLVHDAPDVKVSFAPSVRRADGPMLRNGRVALESGSPVVWFTFPGAWHDIGRFHTAHGVFTGVYANVLTPVAIRPGHEWDTTDLFLDLWLDGTGASVLDADELEEAEAAGWVDGATAARARAEAETLQEAAREGRWPPPVVAEWTLARARAALGRR